MTKTIYPLQYKIFNFSFHLLLSSIFVAYIFSCNTKKENEEQEKDPDANYFAERNEHYGTVPQEVKNAIAARLSKDELQQLSAKGNAVWTLIGPSNIGGRITDIEMPRSNDSIIYAGSASGGIFKSLDYGSTWFPIFDKQSALAIGDIEIDPNNDSIIYAGTGEPNTGGGSITYDGNGIYKSTNAGNTWKNIGLENVGTIGKISVAKTNSNIIYVAAVGNIYQKSNNKGLYKSIDRGATWSKVLYISDSTSINDVAVRPVDANSLFATAWERVSRPGMRVYGGITSNLFKSTDGGIHWTKLFADDANRGKLTIDIPPTNANKLYVSVANKDGSFNNIYLYDGTNFTTISNGVSGFTSYTWWFGGIKCHPTNENIVYYSDFELYRTTNGGRKWQVVANASHVDQHSVFIHPTNIQKVVIGNDGGVYTSTNALANISFCNIPNTQVYDFDLYKADEKFLSAAFQDNSFAHTSTQTVNGWNTFGGGDGVEVRVNPADKTETYSSQYGALNITTNGINFSDRFNWRCPIRLDPANPSVRYFGTNKVYKFNPSQNKWNLISNDLTNGTGSGNFHTITTLAIAPLNNNYIYSGSDDGQVYVTKNGGTSWTNITAGLPVLWTTFIKTDRTNPEIAYVGFSGYRYGIKDAHIYKTTNAGASWARISNDLPQIPVNDIEIDPTNSSTLYLTTDIGVYYSTNDGTNWIKLGSKMPSAVVSTLNLAINSRQLYAATYGRSIYKLSLANIMLPNNNIALSYTKTANNILLQWTSDIEFNNGNFEIEESNNAENFITINKVVQLNYSTHKYDFAVNLQTKQPEKLFYRIKFTDKNNLIVYSSIIAAEHNNSLISIYPNPANNYAIINLSENKNGAIVTVYNNNGKIIIAEKIQANILQQKINLQKLSAGIYTVVCNVDNNKTSYKLVKE